MGAQLEEIEWTATLTWSGPMGAQLEGIEWTATLTWSGPMGAQLEGIEWTATLTWSGPMGAQLEGIEWTATLTWSGPRTQGQRLCRGKTAFPSMRTQNHQFHEFAPPTSAGCVFHNCKNHKSAGAMHNALVRSIREGQDTGTYLVLDFDAVSHWRGITPSPFGCVPKADADPSLEARVIHDLSFPRGASTNDASVQSDLPPLTYEHVRAIARRILCLKARDPRVEVLMMRGDVKSAFRHLFGHPSVIRRFAGVLQELRVLVLDLALPFGWTGSPAHYGAFGSAISFLVRRESPATLCPGDADDESFFCYEWVDDHVLVEQAKGDRLALCDIALRLAMVAVLGPRAINEKKFTSWSTQSRALGLDWDTTACTVSMPSDKVEKALGRVRALLAESTATQSSLSQLLGSLRHVSSCFRPAKPFFQRLATLHRQAYRFVTVEISTAARLDLLWFEHILQFGKLQGVPLRFFADLPDPDVHIFMDASDQGLCALDPARREFLRIEFDEEEQVLIRDNLLSINVREQLSAAFSVLVWGQRWRPATTNELTHGEYMDASDQGLCALDPAQRKFLRIEFDEEEQVLIRDNLLSINVREQLSAAFSTTGLLSRGATRWQAETLELKI
ncbi:hypothetical protein Poli38472_014569 [Pythium oligandrum]|uniref:Reverse transcriptase domain-containing protein n=1 Tax=Pythium oligandrum TaxID=41045 RepID=A0A8K1CQN3_PYTOL|nr:hypothetical protein Poli38472_014569 [Pythium oligandrum]|eukprot:TMW66593.1 hypothetical protein Poli38472_014569 [Pythium oligandrum]